MSILLAVIDSPDTLTGNSLKTEHAGNESVPFIKSEEQPLSLKRERDYDLDPEEFDSDEEEHPQQGDSTIHVPILARQDALTGIALLRAVGAPRRNICGRKLIRKQKGTKCQNPVKSYGMCSNHLKQWKAKNPWLISPGHY